MEIDLVLPTQRILVLGRHYLDVEIRTERHKVLNSSADFDIYSLFPPLPTSSFTIDTSSPHFASEDPLPAFNPHQYDTIVGLTMYNEDQEALERSLRGVLRKSVGGKNLVVKKTLVVVIVDGVRELMKSEKREFVQMLEEWRLYDKDAVESTLKLWRTRPELKPKDCCFVFQSKIDLSKLQEELASCRQPWLPAYSASAPIPLIYSPDGLDILFVVKLDNRRKLHSHLWLMYVFAQTIDPGILIVLFI